MGDEALKAALAKATPTMAPRERAGQHRNRLLFWTSPPDQPGWARPALLVVAGLAALSYAWGITTVSLETFYAAAVRSMALNWHNFFFASFDPWGTVSIDKLPGAFWLQAASVRIFGFHLWAFALPSVIEGTLTVLLIYRVVHRVAGPLAGLTAAVVLAASPVTILLNRGNISDSLLILLLVLAADAATSLIVAAIWVGLAFQAKMLQAWLVLPGIYLAYLLAAPIASLYRRIGNIALSIVVVALVSLSWMTIVTVIPAHDRPYVDGSCDNSLYSQVFLYNAADRLNGSVLTQQGCVPTGRTVTPPPTTHDHVVTGTITTARGPARFLSGAFGRDAAWMLVPALVAFFGILFVRRKQPRRDPLRAAAVMWMATLFFTWSFFASSNFLNSYYLAALIPPLAALCGMGLATAWRMKERSRALRVVLAATVAGGTAYSLSLVPDQAGVRTWVIVTSLVVAVIAVGLLVVSLVRPVTASRIAPVGVVLSAIALLMGSAWASATVVVAGLGPFDSPYQSATLTAVVHSENQQAMKAWPALVRYDELFPLTQSIQSGQTSADVSLEQLATGREYLPVGGFTGHVPSPTLAQFTHDVALGRIGRVLVAVDPATKSPPLQWVQAHCAAQTGSGSMLTANQTTFQQFTCTPPDAGGL